VSDTCGEVIETSYRSFPAVSIQCTSKSPRFGGTTVHADG
jgi:hypothetical protein